MYIHSFACENQPIRSQPAYFLIFYLSTFPYVVYSFICLWESDNQITTCIFLKTTLIFNLSKPSSSCRQWEVLLQAVNFTGYLLISRTLYPQENLYCRDSEKYISVLYFYHKFVVIGQTCQESNITDLFSFLENYFVWVTGTSVATIQRFLQAAVTQCTMPPLNNRRLHNSHFLILILFKIKPSHIIIIRSPEYSVLLLAQEIKLGHGSFILVKARKHGSSHLILFETKPPLEGVDNVSVKSKLQHAPFFENYCSNSPLPGPKCRLNAPH